MFLVDGSDIETGYHLDETRRVQPDSQLTRMRSVLTLYRGPTPPMGNEFDIYFHSADIDKGLFIRRHDWIDMGEPETVTVTIEPGDTLNA